MIWYGWRDAGRWGNASLLNAVGSIDSGLDCSIGRGMPAESGMATIHQHSNLKAGSKGRT
jgi:hypothetical protein